MGISILLYNYEVRDKADVIKCQRVHSDLSSPTDCMVGIVSIDWTLVFAKYLPMTSPKWKCFIVHTFVNGCTYKCYELQKLDVFHD